MFKKSPPKGLTRNNLLGPFKPHVLTNSERKTNEAFAKIFRNSEKRYLNTHPAPIQRPLESNQNVINLQYEHDPKRYGYPTPKNGGYRRKTRRSKNKKTRKSKRMH